MCMVLFVYTLQRQYFSPEYLASHGNMVSNCKIAEDESIDCYFVRPFQRLLSVPIGSYPHHVFADITLGINPKYANVMDTDFFVLISDASQATGFIVPDHTNYSPSYSQGPCFHAQGTPGGTMTGLQTFKNGPTVNASNPVPQEYQFLISTKQHFGACVTATAYEGSYTTAKYYTTTIQPDHGLTLDIYSEDDEGEQYNFRYITVDIQEDIQE